MSEIHVIVISSVRPEPTSAGQIILYRHLVNQPGITLEVYGGEPRKRNLSSILRRIAGRLGRSRLHRFIEDFWVAWGGRWLDSELPETIVAPGRTIVVTVAHGDGFMAAQRYARRHRLPLLVFFQDWWPDMADVHRPFHRLLERKFRSLYMHANAALCVCPGMQQALGENPRAQDLYPIPAAGTILTKPDSGAGKPMRILYSGNLSDYGPMLGEAMDASLEHPEILLQVRGNNPAWSDERKAKMRANGRWLDFAPRAELDAWLASADAFLIPMVFDTGVRLRMETSFPSKLSEFAKFGKPLVVWGPDYCSAIEWGRQRSNALCVTNSDPECLLLEIQQLRDSRESTAKLAEAAIVSAGAEFSSERIHALFYQSLEECIRKTDYSSL